MTSQRGQILHTVGPTLADPVAEPERTDPGGPVTAELIVAMMIQRAQLAGQQPVITADTLHQAAAKIELALAVLGLHAGQLREARS